MLRGLSEQRLDSPQLESWQSAQRVKEKRAHTWMPRDITLPPRTEKDDHTWNLALRQRSIASSSPVGLSTESPSAKVQRPAKGL
ncbi:hypothetical protein ElyMa_005297400 [Elysia marginata]|uniref:Uncharacterized protein n=1 Tax=Elysia marginata TaxID=1093978 RepID=A0AAV4JY39_9GAST|nr:hypothetical protein ElyMa_005297400 [Elysia marginata]